MTNLITQSVVLVRPKDQIHSAYNCYGLIADRLSKLLSVSEGDIEFKQMLYIFENPNDFDLLKNCVSNPDFYFGYIDYYGRDDLVPQIIRERAKLIISFKPSNDPKVIYIPVHFFLPLPIRDNSISIHLPTCATEEVGLSSDIEYLLKALEESADGQELKIVDETKIVGDKALGFNDFLEQETISKNHIILTSSTKDYTPLQTHLSENSHMYCVTLDHVAGCFHLPNLLETVVAAKYGNQTEHLSSYLAGEVISPLTTLAKAVENEDYVHNYTMPEEVQLALLEKILTRAFVTIRRS